METRIKMTFLSGILLLVGISLLLHSADAQQGKRKGQKKGQGQEQKKGKPPGPPTGKSDRPNIVLVLTDDLDHNLGTLDHVPKLTGMMGGQGITFPNMFVSQSLCCPSRSSIQRSQYVHNHHVVGNSPPNGGFEKFHALHEDESTVGTWLKAAGYRTGFMGKYLNGYPNTAAPNYVPPGWDDWNSPAAGNPYGEYNYTMNENGKLVKYGRKPNEYMTTVLSGKATSFIEQTASDRRPFFLVVATYAPHQPATPAPRYAAAFPGLKAPRPPSYNEADVSDKPAWIRSKPILGPPQQNLMDSLFRKRLRTMLSVSDLVENLIATLKKEGLSENTYIIFTSDNGFHMGEHRLHAGKLTPYEEDIRVPLFIRGPGIPAGQTRQEIVANIDLAPTVADLGHAKVPDFVDGRSLVPLLKKEEKPEKWRQAFLIEQEETHYNPGPSKRGVLEPQDPLEQELAAARQGVPAYAALRTADQIYVLYGDGERELYDLRTDPYEIKNLAKTAPPAEVTRLDKWLAAYVKCHGASCREVDASPPH
jgi:N-acetylglucosamine-6-sulfatase